MDNAKAGREPAGVSKYYTDPLIQILRASIRQLMHR